MTQLAVTVMIRGLSPGGGLPVQAGQHTPGDLAAAAVASLTVTVQAEVTVGPAAAAPAVSFVETFV